MGRLFKRKGSGSSLQEERKLIFSSRGEEADLLFKRNGGGSGSSLQEEGRWVLSSRGREADRLFKRRGDGS